MQFNLADYETVEERIRRFYDLHPDGRIITADYSTVEDRANGIWRVMAGVYLSLGDHAADLPKATGHAFEKDGTGGANKTSALENAETSAIGRALANMNLSGNKRASREEMAKVQRGSSASVKADLEAKINLLTSREEARKLWQEAGKLGASKDILDAIADAAAKFGE